MSNLNTKYQNGFDDYYLSKMINIESAVKLMINNIYLDFKPLSKLTNLCGISAGRLSSLANDPASISFNEILKFCKSLKLNPVAFIFEGDKEIYRDDGYIVPSMGEFIFNFKGFLEKYKSSHDMTCKDLSDALNKSKFYYSNFINKNTKYLELKTVLNFCYGLDIDFSELFMKKNLIFKTPEYQSIPDTTDNSNDISRDVTIEDVLIDDNESDEEEKNTQSFEEYYSKIKLNLKKSIKSMFNYISKNYDSSLEFSRISKISYSNVQDLKKMNCMGLRNILIHCEYLKLNPVAFIEYGGNKIYEDRDKYIIPSSEELSDRFTELLLKYKEENSLSYGLLSGIFKLSKARVNCIVNGHVTNVYLKELLKYCYYTNSDISIFFKENKSINNKETKNDVSIDNKSFKLLDEEMITIIKNRTGLADDTIKNVISIYNKLKSL